MNKQEKKKKHDKIVSLLKSKLNSIEILFCKTLIDSNISYNEFVLINNVLKEYDNMKEEIKNLKTKTFYWRLWSIYKPILLYCLKCRNNTESKNPKVLKTKNERIMLLSKCAVYGSKSTAWKMSKYRGFLGPYFDTFKQTQGKSRFIKEQEASGLVSSLGIKTPLSKIPLVGILLS